MATTLYFRTLVSDYGSGTNDARLSGTASGWQTLALSTSMGSSGIGASTATVAGPTNGVEVSDSTPLPYVWYSAPLDADVTIAGSITWNLVALESATAANTAINGRLEVVDGATGTVTLIDQTTRVVELGTTSAAQNFAETPAAGVACKRGDRLRVRVFGDDATGVNMGSGRTFSFNFNGTGAASNLSYLTLTENLTFAATPVGSTVYPTDTASTVSTASVDREAWTSRGAGVQTDVTNTVAGWTAPIHVTDTAGGTVVDWFTRPLTAFTLGGAVNCNIRAASSGASTWAGVMVEVAVTAGDGTGAVVWAKGSHPSEVTPGEAAYSFLVSGDDLSVSAGQRLRLRLYVDNISSIAMVAARTVTLYYAGTSGGASGDTYLTFSQTLTEYSAGTPVPFKRDNRLIQQLAH